MTFEALVRIGVMAKKLWPGLTANCRIEILPYDRTTRCYMLYDTRVKEAPFLRATVDLASIDDLSRYKDVRLGSYGGQRDSLAIEWYMGASEELDTLLIMPAEVG